MYSEIPLIFEAKFLYAMVSLVFHITMVSTRVTYCFVFYCIPQYSYLNFYLQFSATVTPGAKVSATEIPTQRAMRNPAKPLLKSMSRMVISIKVLARIILRYIVDKFQFTLDIFPAFLNLYAWPESFLLNCFTYQAKFYRA